MKPKVRTNILIALAVVAFCIFIALVMVFRIGKFTLGKTEEVKIVFNFVNGLDAGAPVRFGGALVGKVDRVEVLNGSAREKEGRGRNILVVAAISKPIDLTEGTEVTVNTMGFIGEKYIELRPGPLGSPPLKGNWLVGDDPAQMEKLISSGQKLIDELQVTAVNLNRITKELDARLPGLSDKMDHALGSAERAMDSIGSEEAQEMIKQSLANLKVITAYGKIFTTTVAEKPWRLVWGGKVRPLPPESEILGKPAAAESAIVKAKQADPAPISQTNWGLVATPTIPVTELEASPPENTTPVIRAKPDTEAEVVPSAPVVKEAPSAPPVVKKKTVKTTQSTASKPTPKSARAKRGSPYPSKGNL